MLSIKQLVAVMQAKRMQGCRSKHIEVEQISDGVKVTSDAEWSFGGLVPGQSSIEGVEKGGGQHVSLGRKLAAERRGKGLGAGG